MPGSTTKIKMLKFGELQEQLNEVLKLVNHPHYQALEKVELVADNNPKDKIIQNNVKLKRKWIQGVSTNITSLRDKLGKEGKDEYSLGYYDTYTRVRGKRSSHAYLKINTLYAP